MHRERGHREQGTKGKNYSGNRRYWTLNMILKVGDQKWPHLNMAKLVHFILISFYDILSVLLSFGFDDVINMLKYYVIKSLTLLFPPT